MARSKQPVRGEVYVCQFEPARGAEQGGTRPALIVERTAVSSVPAKRHVLVAPLTTNPKCAKLPFCVLVPAGKPSGLKHDSYVNTSHLHACSKERFQRRLGRLSAATMSQVDDALRLILDL